MTREKINIEQGQFKEGQLMEIVSISGIYEIAQVTAKAICLKTSDGRWGGNGYKPLWLPISQLNAYGIDSNPERSQFGIHQVDVPEWLIIANKKLW